MAKRVKIPGRLESAETGNIVTGADAVMDDAKGKTQVVINSEVDAAISNLAQGKQDNLTFDSTPTEGSPNPVTSAGVYTADKVLSDAIEAILLLIPSAASALNKLVDMQTMNSSIATATASFKGTYNLVSDLHLGVDATHEQIGAALDALSLDADNNDYAFVQVPNSATAPTEISKTERYKFNGENWLFEYDLNNSGFTQGQWNAINSGVTSLLVGKLSDLPTNAELTTLLAGKQDNLTFDDVPTAGSPNPVKSGGVYARNNEIVALINALDVAKQDVLTFDNAPVEGSPNPVKSGGVYTAISAVQAAIVALDAAKQNVLTFDSTPTLGSPNPVTSSGIKTELNRIDGNITTLNDLYEALTQSALVIVQPSDTWPVASPAASTIYRVVDRANTPPQYYSDYMWNGSAMVLMATYDNAIDDVPTAGSNNLVKSGGVFEIEAIQDGVLVSENIVFTKQVVAPYGVVYNVHLEAGKRYIFKNLSNIIFSAFVRSTESGANAETIYENIEPGQSVPFILSGSYDYIRIGSNNSSVSSPVIFGIYNEGFIDNKVLYGTPFDGNSVTHDMFVSFYRFEIGKRYHIKNVGETPVTVLAKTTVGNETFICKDLPKNTICYDFVPSETYDYIRIADNTEQQKIIVYEGNTIGGYTNSTYSVVDRHYLGRIYCTVDAGAVIPCNLQRGRKYIFLNQSTVIYSLFARETESGENVETIQQDIAPWSSTDVYIPSRDFSYIRMGSNSSNLDKPAICCIYEISELDELKQEVKDLLESLSADIQKLADRSTANSFFDFELANVPKQNSDSDEFNLNDNSINANTSDFYAKYDELVQQYPNYISLESTHASSNETELRLYSVGFPNTTGKRIAIIEAGEHGPHSDARANVFCLYEFVKRFLTSNDKFFVFLRRNYILKVIPVTNPYGLDYGPSSTTGGRGNANDININRNYDADWQPGDDGYGVDSGPYAASEPETQFVQSVMDLYKDANVFINIHSHPNDIERGVINSITEDGQKRAVIAVNFWRAMYFGADIIYTTSAHNGEAVKYAEKVGIKNTFLMECMPNFGSDGFFSSYALTADEYVLSSLLAWK